MSADKNLVVQQCTERASGETEQNHWIKIKVVDKQSGNPLKGVSTDLELSDGTWMNVKTDENGEINIKNLPSGKFKIHSDLEDLLEREVSIDGMMLF